MSTTESADRTGLVRPKRADARRNYDKVIAAAREAFADTGSATSLEEIARRAGVGIGTLYRHFPTRQALLEAVYVDEVEAVCRIAAELDGGDAWEALVTWLHRLVSYFGTKQALAHELLDYLGRDAPLFKGCREALFDAGDPLLRRAQEAGAVRPDVDFSDLIQLVAGITKIPSGDPEQVDHILRIALDGLRFRAPGS
ncbi:MAG TPA: TetR/AcrR family transcriptional regulator [Solirubrobacteraceae bacterium]|nr:TetR/AcrR family transcriptional regulator [Solirubrobacteraceae bacterium]